MPLVDFNEPTHRRRLVYVALAVVVILAVWMLSRAAGGSGPDEWSYTQLVTQAGRGQVAKIEIKAGEGLLTDKKKVQHRVVLPADSALLAKQLSDDGVDVFYRPTADWTQSLLGFLMPLVLLLGLGALLYFVVRKAPRRF